MMTTAGTDWLWLAAGAGLAVAALVLLVWALFWDRARGRKRCPKCWYDMQGAEADNGGAFTCPECGRIIKRERKLRRARRRWRWAIIGLLLLLGAPALPYWHNIKVRGWPEAAPTAYLIWLLHDDLDGNSPFWKEIDRRAKADRLWTWQWHWICRQSLRSHDARPPQSHQWIDSYGALLRVGYDHGHFASATYQRKLHDIAIVHDVRSRPVWPANTPVYVEFRAHNWLIDRGSHALVFASNPDAPVFTEYIGSSSSHELFHSVYWSGGMFSIGIADSATMPVDFDIEFRYADEALWQQVPQRVPSNLIYWTSRQLPLRIAPSIDDVITPWRSAAFDSLIANHMRARLDHFVQLELWLHEPLSPLIADLPEEITVAFTAELLRNGEVVATYRAWTTYANTPVDDIFATDDAIWLEEIDPEGGIDEKEPSFWQTDDWSLRIQSDSVLALQNFDCDTYWDGSVEVPIHRRPYPQGASGNRVGCRSGPPLGEACRRITSR